MMSTQFAKITKKNKEGIEEKIGYATAFIDMFVAGIIAGIAGHIHSIAGIIAFFGLIYIFLKKYGASVKQTLIVFSFLAATLFLISGIHMYILSAFINF